MRGSTAVDARQAVLLRAVDDHAVDLPGVWLRRRSTDHHWTGHHMWIHHDAFPRRE